MIRSFKHKGLENFFLKGKTKGLKSEHIKKLKQILAILNASTSIGDIKSVKPLRCHALTNNRRDEYAVWVNKNWRVTFKFKDNDVFLINYEDYH